VTRRRIDVSDVQPTDREIEEFAKFVAECWRCWRKAVVDNAEIEQVVEGLLAKTEPRK
jgi:hypothetical protein